MSGARGHHTTFSVRTNGPGLYPFTQDVAAWCRGDGVLTLFVQHTSCAIVVQENADPEVQTDLQNFFARLVPPSDHPAMSYLQHTYEGPDDMPAHIKAALLPVSVQIPVQDGRLRLGTWQGLYLFEHRTAPKTRQIAAYLG